ncbi:hypothetical protein [Devosia sp. 2618]|uniref:hypothetical protein n=1 Tax=Devosia sp. 2618 TaxID=3156454 RepID=UPI0033977F3D
MSVAFEDDGCTGFINGWGGLDWRVCCDAHDFAFHTGTTLNDFVVANLELWHCVATQDIFAATLMFIGVMTGGALFFFFGRKKGKTDGRKQ